MQPNDDDGQQTGVETSPTGADQNAINYVPDSTAATAEPDVSDAYPDAPSVTWQSKEFSDGQRPPVWYVIYAIASLAIIAVAYLLLRDVITVVVLFIACTIFLFGTSRRPRELDYAIDRHGIQVGSRRYTFDGFKSFSLLHDASGTTITLLSMKRFMPPLSLRCSRDEEDHVLDTLSSYLPFEEHGNDIVDSITHKFRI